MRASVSPNLKSLPKRTRTTRADAIPGAEFNVPGRDVECSGQVVRIEEVGDLVIEHVAVIPACCDTNVAGHRSPPLVGATASGERLRSQVAAVLLAIRHTPSSL